MHGTKNVSDQIPHINAFCMTSILRRPSFRACRNLVYKGRSSVSRRGSSPFPVAATYRTPYVILTTVLYFSAFTDVDKVPTKKKPFKLPPRGNTNGHGGRSQSVREGAAPNHRDLFEATSGITARSYHVKYPAFRVGPPINFWGSLPASPLFFFFFSNILLGIFDQPAISSFPSPFAFRSPISPVRYRAKESTDGEELTPLSDYHVSVESAIANLQLIPSFSPSVSPPWQTWICLLTSPPSITTCEEYGIRNTPRGSAGQFPSLVSNMPRGPLRITATPMPTP